jgi:hypothetical protein
MAGRKSVLLFAVIAAMAMCLVGSTSLAASNKEQYELAERCGALARATFEHDWHDGEAKTSDGGQIIATFENHYNPTLNKCFYVETIETIYLANANRYSRTIRLWDINENRELGTFVLKGDGGASSCSVGVGICHSLADWYELIKPYMEQ